MSRKTTIVPPSVATVEPSIIDTTTYLEDVPGNLVVSPVHAGLEKVTISSYSFLIRHIKSNTSLLFDLGLRTNWKPHLSPHLIEEMTKGPYTITFTYKQDTADILAAHGVAPESINGIVISHHHWDHVSDQTKFPASTTLYVGPGYKNRYLPGWPQDTHAVDTTSDIYARQETTEINFDTSNLVIAGCRAYDWFENGSFYILDAPGHTTGHFMALARTTPSLSEDLADDSSDFILAAADTVHHCAVFRPTKHCTLPQPLCFGTKEHNAKQLLAAL